MLRLLLALAAGAPLVARACEPPAGFSMRADSERYAVFFRADPRVISVGNYFSVEAVACAKAGGTAPEGLKVDAQMPAHRHGMNSRATVERAAPGRFLARGLMFHMPGTWQIVFDVQRAGETERATRDLAIK
ncbi:MAG: FixH family protein [Betaproteobacteria bacterium]|nr:FixH family protein [Betaproteobacteria bacterium]